MNSIIQFLAGKKTYILVALGGIYDGLIQAGLVHENPRLWALLGVLGVGTMRSALASHANAIQSAIAAASPNTLPESPLASAPNSEAGRTGLGRASVSLALICCASFFFFAACAHLAPGADALVVRTEQTETLAASTFDFVLHVEDENDAFFVEKIPAFVEFCEWLRQPQVIDGTNTWPRATAMVKNLNNIKSAYKSSQATSNDLATAIATLNATLGQASTWLSVISNQPAIKLPVK